MAKEKIRIVSWNIDRGYFPKETGKFLADLKADVYLLTEVDRGNKRTHNVDMFSFLKRTLGPHGKFAIEFHELPSIWRSLIRTGGRGGGVHGAAMFSKHPISNYRVINLSTNHRLSWRGHTIFPELFEPRRGNRIAQVFELGIGKETVSVVNTHLENWKSSFSHRKKQMNEIFKEVKTQEMIFAGDLNPLDGFFRSFRNGVSYEVKLLRKFLEGRGLFDPFKNTDHTFSLAKVRSKLDWIALSSGFRVFKNQNLHTSLSDHNCLCVDVELRKI